jgi:Protein of unknown function (DUF3180)
VKRTHPTTLIALGVLGVAVGFLIEAAATGRGAATFVPPYSLPLTLFVIAAFVVALAVPIRQATHGKARGRIDPFQAARIAVLAKACSLSGGLLAGFGIGVLVFLLTRSVLPASGNVVQAVVSFLGAVALLVGGLIAEHLCTLPPGPGEENGGHSE